MSLYLYPLLCLVSSSPFRRATLRVSFTSCRSGSRQLLRRDALSSLPGLNNPCHASISSLPSPPSPLLLISLYPLLSFPSSRFACFVVLRAALLATTLFVYLDIPASSSLPLISRPFLPYSSLPSAPSHFLAFHTRLIY